MIIQPKEYQEIDFDSPETTLQAVEIMRNKKCLNDVYSEIYHHMMSLNKKFLDDGDKILELGSGGGFLKDLYPDIITSDVKEVENVDHIIDAQNIPFDNNSLNSIFAVHVLHHIPDVTKFFHEADRVLISGGGLVMVEPYWSPLAKYLYKNIHPEPFDEYASVWQLEKSGPMSGSNQALSYLLLKRDKEKFQKLFPQFKLVYHKPFGFIRYIATGGIWLDQKLPNFAFPALKAFEYIISPIMTLVGLHHYFVLKKIK